MRYFEDFAPGQEMPLEPHTVTRAEIVAFAAEFDPQPFHLDEAAAADTLLGGLAASGWHTCALFMRMLYHGWLREAASMGSPGVDSLKWLRPVRPGDVLSGRSIVLEVRALEVEARPRLRSLPPRGDERTRRGGDGGGEPDHAVTARECNGRAMMFFEDIAVGERPKSAATPSPQRRSSASRRRFDPQPFHTDEAAAAASHFGKLCASGWHTLAVWMRLNVRRMQQVARERAGSGLPAGRLGPSPGSTS